MKKNLIIIRAVFKMTDTLSKIKFIGVLLWQPQKN